MIDREKRNLLIKKFRELISGTITNLEFDEMHFFSKEDPVAWLVFQQAWRLYDDFEEHKVVLTKEGRQFFARSLLFLYSDLEYEWPYPTIKHNIKRLFTFITFGLLPQFREPKYVDLGDVEVWPFMRKIDFEEAKRKNKFLYREITKDSDNIS